MDGEVTKGQTLKFKTEKDVTKFLLQAVILCETMGIEKVYA
jgi:hypothetical protein